jgi:hypothetical protein
MAFQLSPGVNVSEVDLTTVVPSVLSTAGAFAGKFSWGPANKIKLIDSELTLVSTFAPNGPNSNTATSFFTAANFLAYGNNLQVVRAVGSGSTNAGAVSPVTGLKNEEVYETSYYRLNNSNTYGSFVARYPGELGNSIKVEVFDAADANKFNGWTYRSYFNTAPGTSEFAASVGGSNDEMHIVIIDAGGQFTGTPGTVLETYGYVSKAIDATINGASNYYKQVVYEQSKFVYAFDPVAYADNNTNWDVSAVNHSFLRVSQQTYPYGNVAITLSGGFSDSVTDGNLQTAFDLFTNKETTDVSLIITGDISANLQNHIVTAVAGSRGDCVAFISPPGYNGTTFGGTGTVINNTGNETSAITSWLNALGTSSSFAVADSGWKYQYDKYNNVYRWIPLNADIAGLCVFTDTIRDPWFSPAGLNRGQIKNCIKLSWNPNKTQRDTLYTQGVNPVVTFPGNGTVLFGDKTLQFKPSAFDRINVRRLFIVLEKAIAQAAKYSLFELNDEFTRAQFVSLVTPFLRDIQGRRGIVDFKVVCDKTNNTQQVIDGNKFVGDIYIKPARSINYIQLNFVAVATGVDFTTIVGAV